MNENNNISEKEEGCIKVIFTIIKIVLFILYVLVVCVLWKMYDGFFLVFYVVICTFAWIKLSSLINWAFYGEYGD